MCRPVIEGMRERKFGRIINISSINGQKGQIGQTNYSAAKAGVHALVKNLAIELAPYKIRVNAIAPGVIETDMTSAIVAERGAGIVAATALGRIGQRELDHHSHAVGDREIGVALSHRDVDDAEGLELHRLATGRARATVTGICGELGCHAGVQRREVHVDHAAYRVALPIDEGQTISQPYIVALMSAALSLTGDERVLEIGTGSGYQTAILAELAIEVVTVERHPRLAAGAEALLRRLGYRNVTVGVGDGSDGWPDLAPYDRVIAGTQFGGYADQVVVEPKQVIALPEGLSFEQGAAVPVNYATAWAGLMSYGNLQPGERVLIHAAAGGVGIAATQIARRRGAEVWGTASPSTAGSSR